MSFADLGLSPELLKAIADVGYENPTPIQEQAIPWVLAGRDVLGIAQTGTGKTGGFTLPMIEILSQGRAKARMPRSLILAPTRELANQAAENFALYGKYHPLSMALLIGGESFGEQEKALDRGVDVLIATPGRLLDMFERGRIILRDVKILVIDEADRMLDMGFIPDVERIVSLLPPLRQTLFFSATMDDQIRRLANAFLQNPKEVRVARQATTAETVRQHIVKIEGRDKRKALRSILSAEEVRNAFIFCNRKRDVGVLYRSLSRHGFKVLQLHGDMPQSERTATLATFKGGDVPLLVCSDVAARGIDVADVSHVFNFDVPIHAEDYVHRIGRTGRAGREGCAFTLATSEDGRYVGAIEKLIGKAIPPYVLDGFEMSVSGDESAGARADERSPRANGSRHEASRKRHGTKVPEAREKEAAAMEETQNGDTRRESRERTGRDRPSRDQREGRERLDDKRGDRRRNRQDRHPADWIPEMDQPDDVIAFGDYVPAFLLAPLTGTEVRALQKSRRPAATPAETQALLEDVTGEAPQNEADAPAPKPRRTTRRRKSLAESENSAVSESIPALESPGPLEENPSHEDTGEVEGAVSAVVAETQTPTAKPRRTARRRKIVEDAGETVETTVVAAEPVPASEGAADEKTPVKRARRVRKRVVSADSPEVKAPVAEVPDAEVKAETKEGAEVSVSPEPALPPKPKTKRTVRRRRVTEEAPAEGGDEKAPEADSSPKAE